MAPSALICASLASSLTPAASAAADAASAFCLRLLAGRAARRHDELRFDRRMADERAVALDRGDKNLVRRIRDIVLAASIEHRIGGLRCRRAKRHLGKPQDRRIAHHRLEVERLDAESLLRLLRQRVVLRGLVRAEPPHEQRARRHHDRGLVILRSKHQPVERAEPQVAWVKRAEAELAGAEPFDLDRAYDRAHLPLKPGAGGLLRLHDFVAKFRCHLRREPRGGGVPRGDVTVLQRAALRRHGPGHGAKGQKRADASGWRWAPVSSHGVFFRIMNGDRSSCCRLPFAGGIVRIEICWGRV